MKLQSTTISYLLLAIDIQSRGPNFDVFLKFFVVIWTNTVATSHYLHFKSHLKQLYISSKMKHFSYKGGCAAVA